MTLSIWTPEELKVLKRLEVPSTKTRKQAQTKAYAIGLRLPPLVKDKWTPEEIQILKSNKFVPGRTQKSCYTKASKLHIPFHPFGISFQRQHQIAQANKNNILEEVARTGNIRATGRKYGVSYATVSTMAKAAGLTNNPGPKDLRGETIELFGARWVWAKNGNRGHSNYWRETSGERRNLVRVIWEQANGPIPKGYCIVLKDGDRFNLKLENLRMVHKNALAKENFDKPEIKLASLAGAALGRLNSSVKLRTDPEYKKKRSEILKKTWDKRRSKK